MTNKSLWRGLTAIFCFLLVAAIVLTALGISYAGTINSALGISTSKIIPGESSADEDTEYWKSEYGEKNATNLVKLQDALVKQAIAEMEEGAVLLENHNNALPLSSSEITKVSLFGRNTTDPVYRGHSAGGAGTNVDIITAFEESGISYNTTLNSFYTNLSTTDAPKRESTLTTSSINIQLGEAPVSTYTSDVKASWVGDVAVVMFTRAGGESSELVMDLSSYSGRDAGKSQLALGEDEKDLMALLHQEKTAGRLTKIIVLINSGWAMEVGWLDEYNVDAALWIGQPGNYGFYGVANILKGDANPSGKLADIYAENSLSSPAVINAGTSGTLQWTNVADYRSRFVDAPKNESNYVVQAEGIYIGYKYYESRYEDVVLGNGSANSAKGSSDGAAWSWAKEVSYPFGYGLSYTTFTQTLDSVSVGADTITAKVTVKNTGSTAGKSVIQLYAQTPYGTYEKQNYVEKSAIQLVAYDKTGILKPEGETGDSVTVEMEVDKYLLASYDYYNAKGYIISGGEYFLSLGDDSHDALNNVLAKKDVTSGLIAVGGGSTTGNAEKVHKWSESFDSQKYKYSEIYKESASKANEYSWQQGVVVTNRFDDCDVNYWHNDTVTYLSRDKWDTTWPTPIKVSLTDEMLNYLNGEFYTPDEGGRTMSDFKFSEKSGINFVTMKDVPYDDDVTWNKYLDQLSFSELALQVTGITNYQAANTVAKPGYLGGDGPDGGMYGSAIFADGTTGDTVGITFCAQVVLASTFSPAMQYRRGELVGEIGLWTGKPSSFAPGGNLHRTPFGGRNFEYMSEDPILCYYGNYWMAKGMEDKGVLAGIKHLVANDQEYCRDGLATFFNEQTLRETSLKGQEGAIRYGRVRLLMQSFNRMGVILSSQSYALCTNVVVNEWGFRGIQETDAMTNATYMQHYSTMIMAGTTTYCYDTGNISANGIMNAILKNDDGEMLAQLRTCIKNVHYALSRSSLINGLDSNATVVTVMPWWQVTMYVLISVFAVLAFAGCVMFVLVDRKIIKKKGGE